MRDATRNARRLTNSGTGSPHVTSFVRLTRLTVTHGLLNVETQNFFRSSKQFVAAEF